MLESEFVAKVISGETSAELALDLNTCGLSPSGGLKSQRTISG